MIEKNTDILTKVYDPQVRALIRKKDNEMLKIFGISPDVDIKVLTSTKDITYVVLPALEESVDMGQLNNIVAAKGCTSSVGSVGTFSTAGTICSTASSLTTALSAGSAGSVDT